MDDTQVGQIASWVGLDVGKQDHHATVISTAGERLFELAVSNDEAAIERLLDRALESGPCALVIDQPGSIGSLAVCLARRRGVPVAYVPGLVMRRASELYPGEAKTDRRDSFVLADTARTHARRLHWLEVDDETLERLRLLGGYDDDLAHDVNRAANRLRDMLLAISPALERVLGPRLDHPVARALLQRYPTPTALRAAGKRRLTPLAKWSHSQVSGVRLSDR
jgi:transposase